MNTVTYHAEAPPDVIEQVAQIYIECFTGPPRFETWNQEQVEAHVRKFLEGDGDLFTIAEDDGTICAFAIGVPMRTYFNKGELMEQGANENAYYFAELGTRERYRGRGFGSTLHGMREAEARRRGFSRLNVRVRQDNDVNIRLLDRRGFSEVGRYKGEIKDSVSERLVMEKILEPAARDAP